MTVAAEVIGLAASKVGLAESPPGSNSVEFNRWYYGKDTRAAWCATFVSWAFFAAGLPLPASTPKGFAYTPSGALWFQRQNRWSKVPQVGAVTFFHWASEGRIAHVGIVEAINPDGTFLSIEGNTDVKGGRTGGRVLRQVRAIATVGVQRGGGWGLPGYTAARAPQLTITPGQPQEVDMQITPHEVTVEKLDAAGNGHFHIPNVSEQNIHGFVPRGSYPPADGYWRIPRFGRQQRGSGVEVEVFDGPPHGSIQVTILVRG